MMDIVIPEHDFGMRWNMTKDGSLWMIAPDSISEVGCIHTAQGLELDYIGVIIGTDMRFEDDEVRTFPECRSKMDHTIRGWKKMLTEDRNRALELVDRIIRNTYRTLMTRGMKGCYIWCEDEALADRFKEVSKVNPRI
jgi:hypothetical protein